MPSRRSHEDNVIAPTAAAISTEVSGSIESLDRITGFWEPQVGIPQSSFAHCGETDGGGAVRLSSSYLELIGFVDMISTDAVVTQA